MASDVTRGSPSPSPSPVVITRQLLPLSVLLYNTPPSVPAYNVLGVLGSIASAVMLPTLGKPTRQLPPLSVLLYTPPSVPAYNVLGVLGSIARAMTSLTMNPVVSVRPVLTGLQLPPLFALWKTPPP